MELRTHRLVLRDFRPSDADRMASYQSDPRYLEHYDHTSAVVTDARELVDLFCRWAEESPRTKYQLAITLDDRVIGTCGIRRSAALDDDAEFGCELDPDYWHSGFAREAGTEMLRFGFAVLGLRRIHARTLPTNGRAIALAKSLGLRPISDDVLELLSTAR